MAEKSRLASYQKQEPATTGGYLSRMLQSAGDEALGALERYGRRSGAQRDASLALLNQAADPNTDPLTGAGMKALGLAGLITHPLAFFPTREEWDQRLQAAGNDGRMSRSIGGFLSDLPSLIDPQMAAGGAALAAAPIVGKLGRGIGDLAGDATDAELAALRARLQAEAAQTGGAPSPVSREQALQGLVGGAESAPDGARRFYRGTTGGTERIKEPFAEARGLTFVARKPESARLYGHSIEEVVAKPGAKILDDESPDFWKLIGRRRPPNGYVGSARGGTVAVVNDAIKKAKEAGYDAVSFSSDADIGTVLINESAFIRGGKFSGAE